MVAVVATYCHIAGCAMRGFHLRCSRSVQRRRSGAEQLGAKLELGQTLSSDSISAIEGYGMILSVSEIARCRACHRWSLACRCCHARELGLERGGSHLFGIRRAFWGCSLPTSVGPNNIWRRTVSACTIVHVCNAAEDHFVIFYF